MGLVRLLALVSRATSCEAPARICVTFSIRTRY